mmetsp:Transcript_4686/g.19264  ORF Transcript_4686/g.19264 Transcript_4686/m.19264 type:complete len:298 (-) Transcript_4686:1460-2353(-)
MPGDPPRRPGPRSVHGDAVDERRGDDDSERVAFGASEGGVRGVQGDGRPHPGDGARRDDAEDVSQVPSRVARGDEDPGCFSRTPHTEGPRRSQSRGCVRAEDEEARRRQARVFGAENVRGGDPGGGQGLDRAGEVQRRAVHGCFAASARQGRREASRVSRASTSRARSAETVPSGATRAGSRARGDEDPGRLPRLERQPVVRGPQVHVHRPAGAGARREGSREIPGVEACSGGCAKTPQATRRGARTRANAARGEGDGREGGGREGGGRGDGYPGGVARRGGSALVREADVAAAAEA